MIEARKIRWLERLFVWELRRVMRRRFYGVYLRGMHHLQSADGSGRPLVFCANHTNWWDGFTAALLIPLVPKHRIYMAQSEDLLKLYKPLRWLGAFGVDIHGSPVAGTRYALGLLADPGKAVWVFPQGVLLPQWMPIEIKPGALWLARHSGALVVPLAFRYEWMVESRPSVFIQCGEAMDGNVSAETLAFRMQELFDSVGESLCPVDLSAYRPLFQPRMSMNKVWERYTHPGPFNPRNE